MKGTCQYFRFKISVNHCKKCIAMYNINKAFHDIVKELLFSPTCSFIRLSQTSYRGFSRKTKRS